MKIALIAPLIEAVPPLLYGGTERVVSTLTEELVRRGHAVTLFASADSRTNATLVPCAEQALRLEDALGDAVAYKSTDLVNGVGTSTSFFPLDPAQRRSMGSGNQRKSRLRLFSALSCVKCQISLPLIARSLAQGLYATGQRRRVVCTPRGLMARWMYIAVASPKVFGFIARMTCLIPGCRTRATSSRKRS
jgi:hypothetical protein